MTFGVKRDAKSRSVAACLRNDTDGFVGQLVLPAIGHDVRLDSIRITRLATNRLHLLASSDLPHVMGDEQFEKAPLMARQRGSFAATLGWRERAELARRATASWNLLVEKER